MTRARFRARFGGGRLRSYDAAANQALSGDTRGGAVTAGATGGAAVGTAYGGPVGGAVGGYVGGYATGKGYDAVSDMFGSGGSGRPQGAVCTGGPDCTLEPPEFWLAEAERKNVPIGIVTALIDATNAQVNASMFANVGGKDTTDWVLQNSLAGSYRRLEQSKALAGLVAQYPEPAPLLATVDPLTIRVLRDQDLELEQEGANANFQKAIDASEDAAFRWKLFTVLVIAGTVGGALWWDYKRKSSGKTRRRNPRRRTR